DLLEQNPPKRSYDGRADINGQKPKPAGGRPAHAAVVGPGSAINGEGKRIDDRIVDQAPAGFFPLFGCISDEEKEGYISYRYEYDDPGIHGFPALPWLILLIRLYNPGREEDDRCPADKNIGEKYRNAPQKTSFAEQAEYWEIETKQGQKKQPQKPERFIIRHGEPALAIKGR
ncbi:MAG: hypothetical protein KDD28_35270, partial [Phaeodactylibacter sp.]|nr:hypothetical protein [Phaeodactylibacter sp.]